MNVLTILLDLDGVLADFHRGFLANINREKIRDNWPIGTYNLEKVLDITEDALWGMVPRGLFARLPEMPDMRSILDVVQNYDPNFHICTSPGPHAYAVEEKINWVREHIDPSFNRFHVTTNKTHLVGRSNVLVDDWDVQHRRFSEAGGMAVLLPRPWNSRFGTLGKPHEILRLELEYLQDAIAAGNTPVAPRYIPTA